VMKRINLGIAKKTVALALTHTHLGGSDGAAATLGGASPSAFTSG